MATVTNRNDKAYDPRAEHTSTGQQAYTVYGKGGKARHEGYFSGNNPYFANLTAANNNQDKDALYELAIQWEADYANRQMQLEENRAILEEQREYDSPLAQIQRQREAGINPDIAGASGGSGSTSSGSQAQLVNPGMADQTGQTKFSNKYDNTALVFEGINTAVNAIGTFVGAYGNIANSIAQFKQLPSQISLNEAQANLNNAQAGEINSLLSGKKKSLDLSNALKYIDTIGGLASMIKPDASDDEFVQLVTSAGIPEVDRSGAISAIRQAQTQPAFLANYKNQIVADRKAQAQMEVYSGEVMRNLVDEELQLHEMQLDFNIMSQGVSNSVQRFLSNSPQYIEDLADISRLTAANSIESLEFAREQLRRDFSGYEAALESMVSGIEHIQARQDELTKIMETRSLNPVEQLEFDSNNFRIQQIYSLGSQEVGKVYSIIGDARRQKYYLENNAGYDKEKGTISHFAGSTGITDEMIIYGQIAFGDVLTGVYTTQQLTQQWFQNIVSLGSAAVQGYGAYNLGKVGNAPSTVKTINKTTTSIDSDGVPYQETFTTRIPYK